jgi:histidyl-tRNA synthetase
MGGKFLIGVDIHHRKCGGGIGDILQRPKGTRDLFGEEIASIRQVMQTMSDVFKRYGYVEVETPIFEHLELFEKKSGASIIKQLYAFKDKSGRMLALRPELTASVVRLYIERLKAEPKPLKLFYFGSCFRYEEPQAKRWRQFLQAGLELIGSARPEADAEVVALAYHAIRELGLKSFELRIGHIRVLREVLVHAGVEGEAQDPIMRTIDSKDETRLDDELKKASVGEADKKMLKALVRLRGSGAIETAEKIVAHMPKAKAAIENLREILGYLKVLGVKEFTIDFGIARGLEYYTDLVFELYVGDVQIGGGGRYDELISLLGGEQCPAVGVGFGIDRIADALLAQGKRPKEEPLDCMLLPAGENTLPKCLEIAQELRGAGLRADVDLMGRSLAKAITYANSRKVRYVVIVGPKELAAKKVTLRDMQTGKQVEILEEEILDKLRSA